MIIVTTPIDKRVSGSLRTGGIVVLRTDTLYGVLARADDQAAVERVYRLKHRNEAKSPIVLIADRSQLYDKPSETLSAVLDQQWPGKVSVIIPSQQAPTWIRRDNGSVAYRLPADELLRQLLWQTGPLIAPSANPESFPPATTVAQAVAYFGDKVDVYVDGGTVTDASPSQLLQVISSGEVERLR